MSLIHIQLSKLEKSGKNISFSPYCFEFHISRRCRDFYHFDETLFSITGNVVFANLHAVRLFAKKMNGKKHEKKSQQIVKAGHINAMGLIDEIIHYVIAQYRIDKNPDLFNKVWEWLNEHFDVQSLMETITKFVELFPPLSVYRGEESEGYLAEKTGGISNFMIALEEMLLLYLANENPAFSPFIEFFDDEELQKETPYLEIINSLNDFFKTQPVFDSYEQFLIDLLRAPVVAAPNSLTGQLLYIKDHWGLILSPKLLDKLLHRLLVALDFIKEEEKVGFVGPGPGLIPSFDTEIDLYHESLERFSPDQEWMPNVVLIAKNIYVWLDQLSKKYQRAITRLDQIPDEELDALAYWGFTGIWLIGIWQRSSASQKIKQYCGNPEALASAYSVYDYVIADEIGGDEAYNNLKFRAWQRGVRLAVDMVPNHTGIYSRWIIEHPDWFIQLERAPFPKYSFTGANLSEDDRVGLYIEDGYWNKTDAAVVLKRVDNWTGQVCYIYHGNDGTSMPWNDTAQLNFLLPEVREAIIQQILHVCRYSSIIRFDAAMTLSKMHFERLWYPQPGTGGDIPSRAEYGLPRGKFNKLFPLEFWREVVDRVAKEVPDTLLLAEAFWLMEGYFVRTLGMHRVYNSAFMNMFKLEENANYRMVIKNVLEFNSEILRRFVNFMENPDEVPAVIQFGKGDKYFGICVMMVTMPGLCMFGHSQIQGFSEKYGMEYRRSYWYEETDWEFFQRHEREIFPLLKRRYLFANVENFLLYDVYDNHGKVNENCFVYSNRVGDERVLILYQNKYETAAGWIKTSVAFAGKDGNHLIQKTLAEGLGMNSDPLYYYIFTDHISGLEYIRQGKEIHERGLYVELQAYKYHIFLNFREIRDNEWGDYARICNTLEGRGVYSVEGVMNQGSKENVDVDITPTLLKSQEPYPQDGNQKSEVTDTNTEIISQESGEVKYLTLPADSYPYSADNWSI